MNGVSRAWARTTLVEPAYLPTGISPTETTFALAPDSAHGCWLLVRDASAPEFEVVERQEDGSWLRGAGGTTVYAHPRNTLALPVREVEVSLP